MITQWIQAGHEYVAVDERGSVCGRLFSLDDELLVKAFRPPRNGAQSSRGTMLREKNIRAGRNLSEPRRVVVR